MKYKVIGWTEYDNSKVENGECSNAIKNAIVDCIKENKYCFTGWDHQERFNCAPVLNNGKKYLFTQRGFGRIMAEAHGYFGYMDYAHYSFDHDEFEEIRVTPPSERRFKTKDIVSPSSLYDEFSINVSREIYNLATANHKIVIEESTALKYLDAGDKLTLIQDNNVKTFKVKNVDAEKDLTKEEFKTLMFSSSKELAEKYKTAKILLTIELE